MLQQPVPIQLSLEPAWFNEEKEWNVKLAEKDDTDFILDRTASLNGGLTFTISIRPVMNRHAGTFLSKKVYEEDGTYHYYAQAPLWRIYDHNGQKLDMDVIANGQGDRQFSFTLSKEEVAKRSSQGLVVEFNGIVAYGYTRT